MENKKPPRVMIGRLGEPRVPLRNVNNEFRRKNLPHPGEDD